MNRECVYAGKMALSIGFAESGGFEKSLTIKNRQYVIYIMRKLSLLFIAFLFTGILGAQPSSTKEQQPVQQTIGNIFTALTNADAAGLKLYCTDDVKFYGYGQIWTIDTLIQKAMQAKSIPDFKRTNSFEFVSTTINKKTAWATYYLQSAITRNGKQETIKWQETVILIKEKNKWKINVLHSTRLVKN
jgi:ketosteroid isomerase-like protein